MTMIALTEKATKTLLRHLSAKTPYCKTITPKSIPSARLAMGRIFFYELGKEPSSTCRQNHLSDDVVFSDHGAVIGASPFA